MAQHSGVDMQSITAHINVCIGAFNHGLPLYHFLVSILETIRGVRTKNRLGTFFFESLTTVPMYGEAIAIRLKITWDIAIFAAFLLRPNSDPLPSVMTIPSVISLINYLSQ